MKAKHIYTTAAAVFGMALMCTTYVHAAEELQTQETESGETVISTEAAIDTETVDGDVSLYDSETEETTSYSTFATIEEYLTWMATDGAEGDKTLVASLSDTVIGTKVKVYDYSDDAQAAFIGSASKDSYDGSTLSGKAKEVYDRDPVYKKMGFSDYSNAVSIFSFMYPKTKTERQIVSEETSYILLNKEESQKIIEYVNEERVENGIAPLTWNDDLYDLAVQRCYEDDIHESMRAPSKSENCYHGIADAEWAHHGWFTSTAGHHENYMNAKWVNGAAAIALRVTLTTYNDGTTSASPNGGVAYEVFN